MFPQLGSFLGDAGPQIPATSSVCISFCCLSTPSSQGPGGLGAAARRGHPASPCGAPQGFVAGARSVMPGPAATAVPHGSGGWRAGKRGIHQCCTARGVSAVWLQFLGGWHPPYSLRALGEQSGGERECIPLLGKAGKSTRLKGRDPDRRCEGSNTKFPLLTTEAALSTESLGWSSVCHPCPSLPHPGWARGDGTGKEPPDVSP